jgi:hypothetical protein
MLVEAQERACAQVISNSPFVVLNQLYIDRLYCYRKTMKSGLSKAVDQQLTIVQTTPSVATVSAPQPVVGTCLTICSNVEARKFSR